MSRWRFLIGLFGGCAASQTCAPVASKVNCNGECPVCRFRVGRLPQEIRDFNFLLDDSGYPVILLTWEKEIH